MKNIPRSSEECVGGECSYLLPAGAVLTRFSGCGLKAPSTWSLHKVRFWISWSEGTSWRGFSLSEPLQYLPWWTRPSSLLPVSLSCPGIAVVLSKCCFCFFQCSVAKARLLGHFSAVATSCLSSPGGKRRLSGVAGSGLAAEVLL